MKFFDAVFDPGENPAAPHHTYVTRSLNLLLFLKFAAILDSEDTRLFWKAMTRPRSPETEREAVSAIDNVIRRVCTLSDSRSRQLVGETLHWARNHIGRFSFWMLGEQTRCGHLPNLFTLPALFDSISRTAKDWDCNINKIIHDQQGQLEKTLKEWHALFESVEPKPLLYFGDIPFQPADIRDSQFEIGDSRVSPGLQIVDVALWTLSRVVSNQPLGRVSNELHELCFSPKDAFIMSIDWIVTELAPTMDAVMGKPMGAGQLWQGMRFVEHAEQLRQRSIREDLKRQALGT